MYRELRPSEMGELRAAWQLNPRGPDRGDLQAAIITANVLNALGAKRKGSSRGWLPKDFMFYLDQPAVERKPQEAVDSLLTAFGFDPKQVRAQGKKRKKGKR